MQVDEDFMLAYVVRLNPDPRNNDPYCAYLSCDEYDSIHAEATMNGFEEAVNFLPENGVVRGYLPPRHLRMMRSAKPFVLVSTTAAKAKNGGNRIVGIQAGCCYVGQWNKRRAPNNSGITNTRDLRWHYTCDESLSLLLPKQIPNARKLILKDGEIWGQTPVHHIDRNTFLNIISKAKASLNRDDDKKKLERIILAFNAGLALNNGAINAIASNTPAQVPVFSLKYMRDSYIVNYALQKAKGICGDCKKPAPFTARATNKPYLEVHHITMLSAGGKDTTNNVIALCPNCHRKRHHG